MAQWIGFKDVGENVHETIGIKKGDKIIFVCTQCPKYKRIIDI